MTEHDPYRVPPVTGPHTRRELRRARIKVWFKDLDNRSLLRWCDNHPFLVFLMFMLVCMVVLATVPVKPGPDFLVECPDRTWVSQEYSSERNTVRDTQGRRVHLPPTCYVTEIPAADP